MLVYVILNGKSFSFFFLAFNSNMRFARDFELLLLRLNKTTSEYTATTLEAFRKKIHESN